MSAHADLARAQCERELEEVGRERDMLADLVLELIAIDPRDDDWRCVYCLESVEHGYEAEQHAESCPWARARGEVLPHRVRNGEVEHDTGPSDRDDDADDADVAEDVAFLAQRAGKALMMTFPVVDHRPASAPPPEIDIPSTDARQRASHEQELAPGEAPLTPEVVWRAVAAELHAELVDRDANTRLLPAAQAYHHARNGRWQEAYNDAHTRCGMDGEQ